MFTRRQRWWGRGLALVLMSGSVMTRWWEASALDALSFSFSPHSLS